MTEFILYLLYRPKKFVQSRTVSIDENVSQQANAVSNIEKYRQRRAANLSPLGPAMNLPPIDDTVLLGWSKFNLRATEMISHHQNVTKDVGGAELSLGSDPAVSSTKTAEQNELHQAANEMKAVIERTRSCVENDGKKDRAEDDPFLHDLYTSIQVVMSGLFVLQLQCQQSGGTDSELSNVLDGLRISCTDMLTSMETKEE